MPDINEMVPVKTRRGAGKRDSRGRVWFRVPRRFPVFIAKTVSGEFCGHQHSTKQIAANCAKNKPGDKEWLILKVDRQGNEKEVSRVSKDT